MKEKLLKKSSMKEIITELMIEKLICPFDNLCCNNLYYNEEKKELIIDTYSAYSCIFQPSKYIDEEKFELNTEMNLREIMSFNDFLQFLYKYTKKQYISMEDAFSQSFHDLSLLYFFDKKLYKKYARKQAEEFLKNTILYFEKNKFHFKREKIVRKIVNEKYVEIPSNWMNVLNFEENVEMYLTYDGIKISAK